MSYLINKKFMFLLSKFREITNSENIENELDKIQNITKQNLNLNNNIFNDKKRKLKDLFDSINEDKKVNQLSYKKNIYSSKLLITSDNDDNNDNDNNNEEDDDGFITITKKYKNKSDKTKPSSKINNHNNKSIPILKEKKSDINRLDTSKLLIDSDSDDEYINSIPKNNIQNDIQNNKLNEIKKSNNKKYGNIYLDNLSNDKNVILIGYLKSKIDVLSYLCFECLSDDIYIMQTKDKINNIKECKLDCISIFNIENLFKTCNFTSKECKKSDLDDVFTNNKPINISMLKVIGAVLNINIIYIKNNEKDFLNILKENRATLLIIEHNDMLYTVKKKSGFLRANEIEKYGITIKRTFSKESLEKMKLEEIQNIANSLNIDIKKDGKTGKINKKKEELIEDII